MHKTFLSEDFLLDTETAKVLYHDFAKEMPVIDYHNHLSPKEIADDRVFENITKVWLEGDHYKWRAMRTNGVDENYITGNASDFDKFKKWAETVPYTMRNPLYHWTHMELQNPFKIYDLLNPDTAEKIYHKTSHLLASKDFSVRNLLKKRKVEILCTTDDPVDSLEYHSVIAGKENAFKVFPAFRPDKAMEIESPETFIIWKKKLEEVTGKEITDFTSFLEAIRKRHDYFHSMGCRISDHGLNTMYAEDFTEREVEVIFKKAISGKRPEETEILKFKSAMLYYFALMDHGKGWVQQFHIGAIRNNNSRMQKKLGADSGFDSIGDMEMARPMVKFFDRLDAENKLAKTIIYNLNPRDNELFATMTGNYNDGSFPGKMQYGSAWWFLDQKEGIEKQLNALSNMGLLSHFVGMLTDSRSFLSFSRHEYFRRILCNLIGSDVEKGELPGDIKWLGKIVQDVSYYNAKRYFNLVDSRQ
jgi:glucuronate isomerase